MGRRRIGRWIVSHTGGMVGSTFRFLKRRPRLCVLAGVSGMLLAACLSPAGPTRAASSDFSSSSAGQWLSRSLDRSIDSAKRQRSDESCLLGLPQRLLFWCPIGRPDGMIDAPDGQFRSIDAFETGQAARAGSTLAGPARDCALLSSNPHHPIQPPEHIHKRATMSSYGRRVCRGCNEDLRKEEFSRKQWGQGAGKSR